MMEKPILEIRDLSLGFRGEEGVKEVLHNISFNLFENEVLGIVGESGSGKSVSSLAVMGLLAPNAVISNGQILFEGKDLIQYKEADFRKLRGSAISMIFQEPMSSLNPSMKCGEQVAEILLEHTSVSRKDAEEQVVELFEKVRLPRPEAVYKSYPHQISGGQKQRVMIAMAIACKPKILIADEPTTALDVTVQKEILALLKELQQETGMSVLFISHDLALISEISDRIAVMYKGKIVEQGSVEDVFLNPKDDYTRALIASRPSGDKRLKRLPTVKDFLEGNIRNEEEKREERKARHRKMYEQTPLLEIVNLNKQFISNSGWLKKSQIVRAVNEVNFKLYEGETLGLVGESGCGKSTLGNVILQLLPPDSGQVLYRGKDLTKLNKSEIRGLRKEIQLIFQDPYSSLNPRIPVGNAIMEPMKVHELYKNAKGRKEKTLELLQKVGLDEDSFYRYPHEFSGGQRQRIGIARTIAVNPKLIICDESVSALDISVQAQVLNLLNNLKRDFGFTYIFISHDLAVVRYMADRLMVMHRGKIVESGDADMIYEQPKEAYTQKLIDAIPKGI